ncbi:MAG: hypothetical protein LBK61_11170 [Spirochaetaceae bacterium]|jgi:hypothetical protein|nr:hypothetical protein [Spirochaetaceae bacterium]
MRIEEKAGLHGAFRIRAWKNGVLAEESGDRNMIVDGARFEMARLAAGDAEGRHIVAIALGTNGTPPGPGDTEITEPFVKAVESVEYPTPGQARFNWLVAANEANGMAVMEFWLICADGTLFARCVRQARQTKDSDFLLEGDWTIEFVTFWAHFLLRKKPGFAGLRAHALRPHRYALWLNPSNPLRGSTPAGVSGIQARRFATQNPGSKTAMRICTPTDKTSPPQEKHSRHVGKNSRHVGKGSRHSGKTALYKNRKKDCYELSHERKHFTPAYLMKPTAQSG